MSINVGSQTFSGERLYEARTEIGLTIANLVSLSGVSRSTISKLENGSILSTSLETASALAFALKKPLDFFYPKHDLEIKNITVPSYRSLLSRSKASNMKSLIKLQRVELIIQCLYEYIEQRELDIDSELFDAIDPTTCMDEDIEYIAEDTRQKWELGDGILLNIIISLENHGVICAPAHLPEKVDSINVTFKYEKGETALILFNSNLNYFRQRFSLAHELGHIILHHNCSEDDFLTNAVEFERQANRFASAFLLPRQTFRSSVFKLSLDGALYLKSKWRVSAQAILRRFLDTELIDELRYQNLMSEISRKGWRRNEPNDNSFNQEQPYYLREAFSFIFDNRIASPQDIVEYCSLSPYEISEYAGNRERFMPEVPNINFQLL